MDATKDFARLSRTYLCNGTFRDSAATKTHPVLDPATGQGIGEISETSRGEIDEVVAAGAQAQRLW